MAAAGSWDRHYRRDKSLLSYPDENLVRLLKSSLAGTSPGEMCAADLGCGSGRHLFLLRESGISCVIGMDCSLNALHLSRSVGGFPLMQGSIADLPLRDASLDLAVTWGSLHYAPKSELAPMLSEIRRVLKEGACLLGTLRCARDSYLPRGRDLGNNSWIVGGGDIRESVISFYEEGELFEAFAAFRDFRYGLMERTPLGERERVISHWFFSCRR